MRDLGAMQLAAPFDGECERSLRVLEGGDGCQEIAPVGEAIGADRPAVGQRECAAVVFADVGARRTVDELNAEDDAARSFGAGANIGR